MSSETGESAVSLDRGQGGQGGQVGDIAVIGMAVRLPEADDAQQFLENLRTGRDSVREFSAERKTRTSLPLDEEYQLCGYIEDLDTFDHAFFGVSKGEAQHMAPEHRLLMQVAYQAVENAGYDPAALRGTRTSVYVGDTKVEYQQLARTPEPTIVMGTHVSAAAGRLSRYFGLRGPAAMVDSSCSSALLAVHHAVNDLVLGDAELALVSGAQLNLLADRKTGQLDIGIRSQDGKARSFSAEADGTGSGEAIATVVLKRLDHALRDGDHVHAVIKGIAANNVAGRSSTLTAPDSSAQAEVIERAWEKSGVDPTTISYVEAHGTATRLGDPIEIEALDLAFDKHTGRKHFVAVSTVKSNIGHTWSASGIVGLIKAVLSLRHGELFPSVHAENLSPLIDFANSAVVVTRELTPWKPVGGVHRAGVSSFGVMGTNVHAVLEAAPSSEDGNAGIDSPAGGYWVPVSARSTTSLEANVAALKQWIDTHPELRLQDVQHTLVKGRSHHTRRFAVTATDLTELSDTLAAPWISSAEGSDVPAVALVVSGRCDASPELTRALRQDYPHFDELYQECERTGVDEHVGRFAFQYAFCGLLRYIGLEFRLVAGEGVGKHVLDASNGRVELAEALRRAAAEGDLGSEDLDARVDKLIGRLAGQRVLFVEAGPLSTVSRALAERGGTGYGVLAPADRADGFATFLRDLYVGGANWQWEMTAGRGRRVELPSYQFQRIRCWLPDVQVPGRAEVPEVARQAVEPMDTLQGVSAIWKEVLGIDTVDPEVSFFDLGGDSISSLQVVNRIQTMFGVELDDFALMDYDTPVALATFVDETKGTATQPVLAAEPVGEGAFPASPAQLNIWLASQFEGGSVAFNLTRVFRLTGTVDSQALRSALDALAKRHDTLRASFSFDNGELTQRIAPTDGFTVRLEQVALDEPLPEEPRITELVRQFAARPFDLERGSLLRAQLTRFRKDQHVLTLSTHHIAADGWSLELLTRDLAGFYAAFSRGTPLALPPVDDAYREYLLPERRAQERRVAAAEYWFSQFEDVPPGIDLSVRTGLGGTAFGGAYRGYTMPEALWQRLKSFSQAEGGTAFGSLLSAFAALFSSYTESGELVLGTSLAGRGRQSLEQLVGMFVRTLPLRLKVDTAGSFRDLFGHVRSTFNDARRHLDYSYEELVQELRRRGVAHSPNLFTVLIEFEQFTGFQQPPFQQPSFQQPSFQQPPLHGLASRDLRVAPIDVTLETSVFPLNVMLAEQAGTLEAAIRFDTRLFDDRAIDQLWESFVGLLEAVLDRPGDMLRQLPLLTEREQGRVRTFGHHEFEFDPSVRIHHAVERFAELTPDRVCLSCGDEELTYAQLNARANRLARYFADELQVRPGEVVALVMDRSIQMVESILALWKCGAAYLPVDPGYPPSYVRSMVESSKVRVAAYDPARMTAELCAHIGDDCQVVGLAPEIADRQEASNLDMTVDDSSAVSYVIYTSGSTGVPKGVMVEHLGMLNHLHAKIADLALSNRSVIVQNASNCFDISVWQMFAALFVGGRTVVCPAALQLDPLRFGERLAADRITVLEVVPSYLDTALDAWDGAGRPPALENLEYLMVTGEAVLPRVVNRWLERYPDVPVVNAYGPTEASDDVTHHVMREAVRTDTVPIGTPIHNTLVYVLDEHLRVCPQGVRGEIYVSGIGVSRGYLNAPEQTARVFMTDPFQPERRMYKTGDNGRWTSDGTLEYLGRTDSQVKVRGFRIDLGEVERRVAASPGVKSAAVVVRTGAKDRLCGYVVLEPGGSVDACRAHLHRELPHHMVPADFVRVERMPLTSNGKVDRRALEKIAAPPTRSALSQEPRTDAEKALAAIWQEVLGVDRVGVTDRFFDVGGNSLRAMQVLSRVRSQLGLELDLEALFSYPTIAGLAARASTVDRRADDPVPSLGGPGAYDTAATQNLLLDIERTSANREAFNRNDWYQLPGHVDPALLERGFALLVERHESLRTTFDTVDGRPVQTVHAPGALALPFSVRTEESPDAVSQFVVRRVREPFEPTSESLVRADLLRAGEDDYSLLVSMHQLVCDGRTADVLVDDWLAYYEALSSGREASLPPLKFQYKDMAHWRNERLAPERIREHQEFWSRELEGASSLVPLATDYPRPAVTLLAGARLRVPFPGELTNRISALASELGVTEFVVARCAVGLLLLAETGQTDITMGTYTRGRNRVDFEDQIGFYINTVPIRLRLQPDDDVRSVLTRAQQDVLRTFQHEAYPYGWTMRDLGWHRGADRSPVFDVMVAMDDMEEPTGGHSLLTFEPREVPRRSKEADLLFAFARWSDRLEIVLTYNTEIFSPRRAEKFTTGLQAILEAMLDDRPLREILKRDENGA